MSSPDAEQVFLIGGYQDVVEDGCNLQYRGLTLNRIERGYGRKVSYQVHYATHHGESTQLFDDVEVAVDEFLKLKSKLYPNGRL